MQLPAIVILNEYPECSIVCLKASWRLVEHTGQCGFSYSVASNWFHKGPCWCMPLFQPINHTEFDQSAAWRQKIRGLIDFSLVCCCLDGTKTCSLTARCGISLTPLLNGFTPLRRDWRTAGSGKRKGWGLAMFIHNRWCNSAHHHHRQRAALSPGHWTVNSQHTVLLPDPWTESHAGCVHP